VRFNRGALILNKKAQAGDSLRFFADGRNDSGSPAAAEEGTHH
jgi:hypothetical protein